MDLISLSIIITLLGIAKWIWKLILLDSRQKRTMFPLIQMLKLLWRSSSRFQPMLLLVIPVQQRMAFQEILRASWKQKTVNLFICEWCPSMILKDVKIFSQNIHKNNFIINTILETHNSYDIIFIQELPWFFIHSIPSSMNKEGEELVKVYSHPNWIIFSRNPLYVGDSSRVITYINARLSLLYFSLWKDIF